MKYIGAHVSAEPTVSVAPAEAYALGAGAFSFCPVDATHWKTAPYAEEDILRFKALCSDYGYTPERVLPHASLILNPGSPESRKLNMARVSLADQMRRVASLGLDRLNFHPGAHMRQMSEEEGVCIDTCHAFAAGYDMRGRDGYSRMWDEFERTVGFGYLRGMHLNDAAKGVGSRVDRHAPVGKGMIGPEFFAMLMADPRLDHIPLILETPDPLLWTAEIAWLQAHDNN